MLGDKFQHNRHTNIMEKISRKETNEWGYTSKMWGTQGCCRNSDIIKSVKTNPSVIDNINSKINDFFPGPSQEVDRRTCAKLLQQLQKEFQDDCTGIDCLMAYFHCRLNQIACDTSCHQDVQPIHYRSHLRKW